MSKVASDQAFLRAVPKGCTSFMIWRIEDFTPEPVPKDQYGSFYDGDSYIILAALERGKPGGPGMKALAQGQKGGPEIQVKEVRSGSLDVRIHFWLGKDSSQDERGTAAIKSVELDDYLGGSPVQYRETQGNESKVFLKYFKTKGVRYLKGGIKSGFNHVDTTHKTRLYSIKGKGTPRCSEIDIGWEYMNEGDAFCLDSGEMLFVWNGKSASRTEKIKAMDHARSLRDDRGMGSVVVVEQGEEDQIHEEELTVFEEYLPLSELNKLQPASAGGDDDAYVRQAAKDLKLWKVAEEGNALKVTEISQGPLTREMLDSNDCFIVDQGAAGLWVWVGKGASKVERAESMNNAMAFVKQRGLSDSVRINRVVENGETADFKTIFKVWDKPLLPGQTKVYSPNRIARTVQTKFDASTMHDNPQLARETGMVDDGSGTKKVMRVVCQADGKYDTDEVKKQDCLFGGDSYIIHYAYKLGNKLKHILYYWLGRHSTTDERGVAALKTVEYDDNILGGDAEQVRVVHGKEPAHFLAMFQGKLVVYEGGKVGQAGDEGPNETHLLQVRGTSQYNCKAEQVPLTAGSLNSNDCFVLFIKGGSVYIWAGKGCTGDEREMAKEIAKTSPKGYTLLCEGQKMDEFWNLLGGEKEYSTSARLSASDESSHHPARLFQCSNASGQFKVNEIVDFIQADLVSDDVFILDAFHKVFVWVGDDARPEEKSQAMDAALEYMETDPSGRDKDTPVVKVKQGHENPEFVGYFGVWDWEMWSGFKSYEEMKREVGEKNLSMEQVKASKLGEQSFSDVAKYPYDTLIQSKDSLPAAVDPAHREKHLSDEEFSKYFKMTYTDFVRLMGWKQKQLKENLKLF